MYVCTYTQSYSKIDMECKGPRLGKMTLEKNNKVGRLTLPNFKIYYKTKAIKIV